MTFPTPDRPLRIGTRGSPLALAQAHETRARLMAAHDLPEDAFEISVIKTTGDAVLDRPLSEIGGKGLFTKEIEEALIHDRIDLAVHSMKDVATVLPDGLVICCVLEREDVRDAFICPAHESLANLPAGTIVGTSSLRRRAQLLHRRPDLGVVEFRGNVQTRLKKLADGVAAATFLAAAGLRRLGQDELARKAIPVKEMLPAVAQGAIGIEVRADDTATRDLLVPIHHPETETRITLERAFLAALDGSCRTPIAGLCLLDNGALTFDGEIIRPDGTERHVTSRAGVASDAAALGRDAGEELKARGGSGFFVA